MAEDRMAVLEMLRNASADGDVDFLREGVRALATALMDAEVTELTGVPKGERAPERRLTGTASLSVTAGRMPTRRGSRVSDAWSGQIAPRSSARSTGSLRAEPRLHP